nr:AraC family transcriptional regulator [Pedobacter sp. MC2016-24]
MILDQEYKTAPLINELAKRVYLNEFKLKRGFKICYGITIKSYVIALKMKKALSLLNENKYQISELTYMCGYNSLSRFSSAFKSYYGCSPKKMLAVVYPVEN